MLHRVVDKLPEGLELSAQARLEMGYLSEVDKNIFLRRSEKLWVLSDERNRTLMVVGIIKPSIMSIAEVWMLLCEPFKENTLGNLRAVYEKFNELIALYPELKLRIDASRPAGRRFVEFFGFIPYFSETFEDREYIHYKVSRDGIRSTRRA